ncbi:MAG: patatin-like phospholipase family protein [Oscillospiraceae bacterium]|nr:patatin-like phospholipase family protein [Oscillospiraceae bacterium]
MKYALALGGGGARGAFEAGVWSALRDLNKDITAISGTSVGAINGAAFAAGVDAEELWCNLTAQKLIPQAEDENIISPAALSSAIGNILKGGFETDTMKSFLADIIDEEKVRQSEMDYGLCTFSSSTKKPVELFLDRIPDGMLIDYIIASACFPVFKPVKIKGEEFTDGGIRNNIPIDMLTARGYDTIISVSVRGIGMVKNVDKRGVNLIEINCDKPECGIMEFDSHKIKRSIKDGYMSCMKAFGKFAGRSFFIYNKSYSSAAARYGHAIIEGIERAAELSGVDRTRIYTFTDLVKAVMTHYNNCPELARMVKLIEREPPCIMHNMLDMLSPFQAANAIVYMKKR